MINLIPLSAQKKLKQEYWIRVVSLWAILASVACVILAVLAVPVYVLVTMQLSAQATDVEFAASERGALLEAETTLRQAGVYARLVLNEKKLVTLTEHITRLSQIAGSGIIFTDYKYNQVADGDQITIQGQASTRSQLATFRDRLEAEPLYVDVVLPISALLRETDLEFSITLTVVEPT